MLTHQSDQPVVFNRYSLLVALLLGGLALAVLAGVGITWALSQRASLLQDVEKRLQTWRTRRWFAPLVLAVASLLLSGMWLFFLGDHLPTYGFLRAYLGLSVIVAVLALLFGNKEESGDMATIRRSFFTPKTLIIVFVAILVLSALLTISFYPALMKTDEAVVFSMARNTLESGHLTPTIYRQVNFLPGGLWTLLMAGWLKLTGISLTTGRLYGLVIGYIALGFVWGAAARLYDRLTAWLAVLIGAFAFMSLNHIRYDVHTALFLAMALFFYSMTRTRNEWWLHLLTGFSVGLCVDSNPIAYSFGLGFALMYLGRYVAYIRRERRWFWLPFWALGLGGLIGVGVFFFVRLGAAFAGGASTDGMFSNYLSNIGEYLQNNVYRKLLREYFHAFLTHQPILFGLVLAGILTSYRERTDRVLLILFGTWTATLIFGYYYFPPYYIVQALPILLILGARALAAGIPRLLNSHTPALMPVTALLVGLWLVVATANDVLPVPDESLEDVVETGRQIAKIVPEDAVIVAAEPYYFGMLEHRGFVGGAAESILMSFGDIPQEDTWPLISPDAIVFSSKWSTEPGHTSALTAYMEAQRFVLVGRWETESFGHIELWMTAFPPGVTQSEDYGLVCNPRLGCGEAAIDS
jgi:hypothetical protein